MIRHAGILSASPRLRIAAPLQFGVGPSAHTGRIPSLRACHLRHTPAMHVNGRPQRTIWLSPDDLSIVQIIDQCALPHEWIVADLRTYRDGVTAIADMLVRGAPLIGATTAWSLYLAALEDPSQAFLHAAGKRHRTHAGDSRCPGHGPDPLWRGQRSTIGAPFARKRQP